MRLLEHLHVLLWLGGHSCMLLGWLVLDERVQRLLLVLQELSSRLLALKRLHGLLLL